MKRQTFLQGVLMVTILFFFSFIQAIEKHYTVSQTQKEWVEHIQTINDLAQYISDPKAPDKYNDNYRQKLFKECDTLIKIINLQVGTQMKNESDTTKKK